MSSVYMTEEEQLETLRRWWSKYGNYIMVAISIFFFILATYRYYNHYQIKQKAIASSLYEQLITAYAAKNERAVTTYANMLIRNHVKTVYADTAYLILAKIKVNEGDDAEAKVYLKQVQKHASSATLQQLSHLKMAQILMNEKKYSESLLELQKIDTKTLTPRIDEIKGDVYALQGQIKPAQEAYQQALETLKLNGISNHYLEMKLNLLH